VLLLALGLRLYRIEAQSLWNDEGTSVALAARDLLTITRSAANDIHPPLYYIVLHFWIKLFGSSELAVRSLSALLGTMLVLTTFLLGRSMAMRRNSPRLGVSIGLLAALFAAVSPFQVYYSQETRMYILSALLGTLSTTCFLHLLKRWADQGVFLNPDVALFDRRAPFAAYVLVTTLLLYTHYFAVTVIVAQNVVFLWWLLLHERAMVTAQRFRMAMRWALLQALVAVIYLPWVRVAAGQLRAWPAISEPMPLAMLAMDLLRVFSLGLSVATQPSPFLIGFAALLFSGILSPLFGLWPKGDSSARHAETSYVMLLCQLFVPVGVMYVLSLQRPMYDPKFLLLSTPAFYAFLASGALSLSGQLTSRGRDWLRGVFLLAAVTLIVLPSLYSLQAYYCESRYARDDYRGIARYIEALERDGDAVLINAPGQIETFTYYYRGSLPLYPLPRQRPLDQAQTEAELKQMIEGRERIFAVLWATDESDPERFVESWLDQYTYKAVDSWYGNVRLVVYAVPLQPQLSKIGHPMSVNLGDKVCLLGYNLLTEEVMPGDILQLTLFWEALTPMTERYKVFTHVVDAHGHLVGQRDAEPGGGAKITTVWERGDRILDNYGLPILPATPPGQYTIKIGMYGLTDGQRLQVVENGQLLADHIILQPVRVLPATVPPPLSVLEMHKRLDARFGDVVLLGYQLAKLGYEHQPDAPIRPGDILHLTLFWQANRQPDHDVELTFTLQDKDGITVQERDARPTEGQYPAQRWRAEEIVRDQHNWLLRADLEPGRYCMYLLVRCVSSGEEIGARVQVATVTVE
jgi:mannosyltransferase